MRRGKFAFATLALAGLAAVSSSAFAGGTDAEIRGYSTESHWARLSGRMDVDQVFFGGDRTDRRGYASGANIRRARIDLQGGVNDHFTYRWEADFAATDAVEVKRGWLGYEGWDHLHVRVGQDTPVFGMGYGSDDMKHLTFMEYALPVSAFAPDQALGLWVEFQTGNFGFEGSVFEERDGKPASTGALASDNVGVSGRAFFSPAHRDDYALHFGVYGLYQNLHQRNNAMNFRTSPEAFAKSPASYPAYASVMGANTANDYSTIGLEAAMVYGPWYVQAEYMHTHVDSVAATGDFTFKGYYVEGSYMLTGESRQYSFARGNVGTVVQPSTRHGALELAARFSYLDLEDNNTANGRQHNFSIGANWIVNHHVTFTADYIHARIKDRPATADINLDIVGLRGHVTF